MRENRFPWKLFARIISIQAALLLIALGASGLAARYFFKKQFTEQVESQLHVSLSSLAKALPEGEVEPIWCQTFSTEPAFRLTVITLDGNVLCDSRHDPKTMENQATRPEVAAAMRRVPGQNVPLSSTVAEDMLYGALRVDGRDLILRGAIPLATLSRTLETLDTYLALFLFGMAVVLVLLALWSGRSLAFPIGRLLAKAESISALRPELEAIDNESYGELSDLESSLNQIRRDLEAKAESLSSEREEQATLMSAISDAILAVDLDGAPLFYNSRFVLLCGREELRENKARLWEIFREPEILDLYREALKEGRPGEANALALGQGSARKFFSLSVSPLRRAEGEIYGAVGIFHDVTDLKRAEQMRIDFVANVSHELRTPLTSIKGYTDTLRLDLESGRPTSKEFVEIINRNTGRLMNLINDLLDLSLLESNIEELQKADIDTAEITGKVLKQLEGGIKAKDQRVDLSTAAKTVYADAKRLEQVMVNLLDNASKYTLAGGRVAIEWVVEGGNGVLLKVSDTGPGIAPEHHARLFERFFRVDKARSRELGGTGLGLAIVKHIMQRHGGSVTVESVVGEGATFLCRFPKKA